MGFLDQVQTAGRLKRFLTPRNMQYLGILLEIVTEESSPAFSVVWARFAEYFPGYQEIPNKALGKLRELRQILKESGKIQ